MKNVGQPTWDLFLAQVGVKNTNKGAGMSEITFLTVDLDIESTVDIEPLVREWGDRISVHRLEKVNGLYYGSFETSYSGENEIISEYVDLVFRLSPAAKAVWDNAEGRVFDFGYESGHSPNNFHSYISADSINKLASIGGSIVITIYPVPAT